MKGMMKETMVKIKVRIGKENVQLPEVDPKRVVETWDGHILKGSKRLEARSIQELPVKTARVLLARGLAIPHYEPGEAAAMKCKYRLKDGSEVELPDSRVAQNMVEHGLAVAVYEDIEPIAPPKRKGDAQAFKAEDIIVPKSADIAKRMSLSK